MSSSTQVHWHEGLALNPHHLQALQRLVLEGLTGERRLWTAYPYGLVDAKVATDALENAQVRFERLRAIMPDGLEVDAPGNAELGALDIKRTLQTTKQPFRVFLAVPNYEPLRANAVDRSADDPRVKRRYRIGETRLMDENTGDNAQPTLVRRINARLVTEFDDMSDMQCVPVCRIKVGVGDEAGLARLDGEYIPCCFGINGSSALVKRLRDLSDFVEAARQEQANQLGKSGWVVENIRGVQFQQMLCLRTLNRFAARLPSVLASTGPGSGGVHPFAMYLELRELLGELAGLYPDRDPFEAAKYDHEDPAPVFVELDKKIRSWIKPVGEKKFKKVRFANEGADLVNAEALADEDFTKPSALLLGIKSKMDPKGLKGFIEDAERFKMMPFSQKRLKLFGVKLEEERYPPMELPTPTGLHYFRLVPSESGRMWESIAKEKKIALVWPDAERFEFEEVALYMTYA
jgi:type VI secretion system protein ImpJ